ncbi:MAG: 50S ribosomal protein L6 [Candidatus Calescibacterium sp.]|nr:50S ribosomal protein L6 [Candidatus Calescibacterium sp.]MCX7734019.1 50S ribosomal protein L6 [bacterium]MDW8086382.1 50S ribosomal protein L6 [Candidatus Calescibacterium sp.]
MSRIGRIPIQIPAGVSVKVQDGKIFVKGPKGELSMNLTPPISVKIEDGKIFVMNPKPDERKAKALHGTTRALINNMIKGVVDGYKIELDIAGIGYRADMQGDTLVLKVGYSHLVNFKPPSGVKVGLRSPVRIFVEGIDKQLVGQVAADIRAIRPPDSYKGAGIKYEDEVLNLKPGKAKGKKK